MQRSHGMPGTQLKGDVNVGDGGVLAIHHEHGLQQAGHEQPIHDESGRVAAAHRHFANSLDPVKDIIEHGGIRLVRADDLDQLHELDRVEEVNSDELIRSSGCCVHIGDGQGGCVGGKHRLRLANLMAQPRVQFLLHGQVLHDGLHDQIRVSKRIHVGREENRVQNGGCLFGCELLLRDELVQRFLDAVFSLEEERIFRLVRDDGGVQPGGCGRLTDAMSHQAQPDHPDLVE
mmetsp:Transcript_8426/g.22799  ORF Transcript_8426/g.22799 Transcript_8426/m.22799 type:complete len:232 (-) Transcript_8426:345-1040(-)